MGIAKVAQVIGVESIGVLESNLEHSVTLNIQSKGIPLKIECRDYANPASKLVTRRSFKNISSTNIFSYNCGYNQSTPLHPTPSDLGARSAEVDSQSPLRGLVYRM